MTSSSARVAIAIPCFNEATRFDATEFARFFEDPRMSLVLVDDGSKDDTASVLERFCAAHPGRASCLRLERNRGKGEAVRRGMRFGLDAGADVVGFADADLATPVDELRRMADVLDASNADAVIGARVALLGIDIERTVLRHVLGRVFATFVSQILRERVYDTQCGAKLFRASPELSEALADPFLSRWAFDVELLGRLMIAERVVIEVPLQRWTDVPGSKLRPTAMLGAARDLILIERDLERRRRTSARGRK